MSLSAFAQVTRPQTFQLLADMPTVNFVGEIASSVVDVEEISVTWAIVPGNELGLKILVN